VARGRSMFSMATTVPVYFSFKIPVYCILVPYCSYTLMYIRTKTSRILNTVNKNFQIRITSKRAFRIFYVYPDPSLMMNADPDPDKKLQNKILSSGFVFPFTLALFALSRSGSVSAFRIRIQIQAHIECGTGSGAGSVPKHCVYQYFVLITRIIVSI
jgi:hypothetical protein